MNNKKNNSELQNNDKFTTHNSQLITKKVPHLRFSEFEGEWEEKKTIDIAPLQRGFDLPTSDVISGNYPVVYSNGVLRKHNKYKVKAPGIVTGRSGTIGKITFIEEDFWPHNTSLWITDFFDNDPKFIYYFYIKFRLNRYSAGSTVPTLNRNDVHIVKKRIPHQAEQTKIATFLTAVDKRITLLKKKKDKLEQYKKGIRQKIFSQEIRFKNKNGNDFPDWEEKTLIEVSKIIGGGTPDTTIAEYWDGIHSWLTPTEIKSKYIFKSQRTITSLGLNKSSAKLLPIGSLLFTSRATVGDVGIAVYECSTNQGFQSFIVNEKCNNEFLYYWIKHHKKQFIRRSSGSTFIEISKTEISKIKISLPSIKEQQKIASFLSSIDKYIEKVGIQIDDSVKFKQGLLQRMFV